MINSQRTVDDFKNYDDEILYIPKVDVLKSTKRTILMEYVEGTKIDDIDKLKEQFGDAKLASDTLVEIFARMIFLHGHVHCDAHPGNIFVRPHPKDSKKP